MAELADQYVQMRAGEKKPVFGQAVAQSGTLTIQGQPTCSLYDSTRTVVTGLSALNTTGNDGTAVANPRAWYNLDTLSPTVLAAGYYWMVFKFTALGSDNISRVYEPEILIEVLANP